jgi:hypothetical protein
MNKASALNEQAVDLLLLHRIEGSHKIGHVLGADQRDLHTRRARHIVESPDEIAVRWIGWPPEHAHSRQVGHRFFQYLHLLAGDVLGLIDQARGIAARAREARSQSCAHRVAGTDEYNRDRCRGFLGCNGGRRARAAEDDVHVEVDELGSKSRETRWIAVRPSVLEANAPTLDIT